MKSNYKILLFSTNVVTYLLTYVAYIKVAAGEKLEMLAFLVIIPLFVPSITIALFGDKFEKNTKTTTTAFPIKR